MDRCNSCCELQQEWESSIAAEDSLKNQRKLLVDGIKDLLADALNASHLGAKEVEPLEAKQTGAVAFRYDQVKDSELASTPRQGLGSL